MLKSPRMLSVGLLVLVVSSSATAITVDGNWKDWFTSSLSSPSLAWWYNGGTTNLPTTEASAIPGRDQLLPTGVISGAGYALDYENHATTGLNSSWGEVYGGAEDNRDNVVDTVNAQAGDIEAMLATVQTELTGGYTLYLGIISGMTRSGQLIGGKNVYAGDVFFDFDGSRSNGYDAAVRVGSAPGYTAAVGALFSHPSATANPEASAAGGPYRVANSGVSTAVARVAWDQASYGYGSHHFVEMSFALTSAQMTSLRTNGIDVHWTLSSGGDVFNPRFQVLARPPVPEPSTLALLGIGLAGLGLWRKKKA